MGIKVLDGLSVAMFCLSLSVPIIPAAIAFCGGLPAWNCLMLFLMSAAIMALISPFVLIPLFISALTALKKVRSVRVTPRGITVQTMLSRRELRWDDIDIEIPYSVSESTLRIDVRYQRPVMLTSDITNLNQLRGELSTNIRHHLKNRETSD